MGQTAGTDKGAAKKAAVKEAKKEKEEGRKPTGPNPSTPKKKARRQQTKQTKSTGGKAPRKLDMSNFAKDGGGLFDEIKAMSTKLTTVYGPTPAAFLPWDTSLIGTVIGLICAQNTKNEWSSIMYSNLLSMFPGPEHEPHEPNWEKMATQAPRAVEVAICNGQVRRTGKKTG
jgi:hypothetical protein